jgi:hypothetical protein
MGLKTSNYPSRRRTASSANVSPVASRTASRPVSAS